jgi:hypothetical protein
MTTKDFYEIDQFANGTSDTKIITIKSVYKTGKQTIQPAYDPTTNWYAGVARLSEEQKKGLTYFVRVGETGENSRFNTKLVLKDGYEFNLNKEVDKINWEWAKHCKEIALSLEDAQKGKALFYVHIEGRESASRNSRSELAYEAMTHVMKDMPSNYVNRALLLGMDMALEHPETVKEYLLDVAKNTPEKIIRVYRDKGMKINLLFVKAKQKNIITTGGPDNVIKFDHIILGTTEEGCIAYLKENKDILELLERRVNPEYFAESTVKKSEENTGEQESELETEETTNTTTAKSGLDKYREEQKKAGKK